MAGPGIGAFAAGFLDSFIGAKNQKAQQEQEKKEKDILLKLAQLNLENAENRQAAFNRVSSALTGGQPTAPMEELQTQDPGQAPQAAQPNLIDLLVSGMLPDFTQAQQFQSRQNLAAGAAGSNMDLGSYLNTPEGGSAAIAANLSPSEFLQGQRGDPSSIAIARSFGLTPGTPEFQETVMKLETQDQSVIDIMSAQMGLMKQQMDLQSMMDEMNAKERTGQEAVTDIVESATEIADSLDVLEGSFLETGVPGFQGRQALMSVGAFASGLTGIGDPEKMREVLTAAGQFQKATSNLVNNDLARRSAAGIPITDAQRQSTAQELASAGLNPAANRIVLIRVLRDQLRDAERLGMSEGEQEEIKGLVDRLEVQANEEFEVDGIPVRRVR